MVHIALVMELERFSPITLDAARVAVGDRAELLVHDLVNDSGDDKVLRLEVTMRECAFLVLLLWADIFDSLAERLTEREEHGVPLLDSFLLYGHERAFGLEGRLGEGEHDNLTVFDLFLERLELNVD